jgi:ElaB/YqjD/DUF883 family membrane-anchored ribosome-binding protein
MERTDLGNNTGGNGHIGEDLKAQATAKIDDAMRYSEELMDRVESFVRERPGTAILAALGAGYLIGRLVRRI